MRDFLSKRRTIFILFLEGFVSVSLQMLMMRQLVPFVGSSVVVSSLVVGVFLASLSAGYAYGGRVKKDHIHRLVMNVLYSSIILSVGISYKVMNGSFVVLNELINNPLLEVSVYLMLFLAPIVFFLGQTVPLLTNFYKSKSVSEVAGDSFAINTIGSVLGSVVTAIVFFNFFGMSKTILIDVLFLGIVLFLLIDKSKYLFFGIIYSIILFTSFVFNVSYEKDNFQLTNAYNNYQIADGRDGAYFIMNKSYASAILNNGKNWNYINKTKEILFNKNNLGLENKNILILGAGGFTLSHGDNIPDNNYIYVDIDPDIKTMAEKYFLEDNINGEFVAEDARLFVNKSNIKYDAVLVDLYSNKTSIPWHLLTNEFIYSIKKTTTENGTVIFNIISNGIFGDAYSRNIYNTIMNNFNYCSVIPENQSNDKQNIIYVCQNIIEKERTIYVDDIARSALDEIKN